ncbi:MAG TPA: GNAT family N-acetyltransferase [Ensifer sp.]|jgi:predicted GNAT family acetyltransferase|uniref:GNAT family N-acetyltransferase n=1 Tax=Ensifer sp. TaxID=1872086 RepID=UPI002E130E8C|nr:GNAT family N-acetyltransferase [Ensifer sp.]
MPQFSTEITNHWRATFSSGTVVQGESGFTVALTSALDDDSEAMMMKTADRKVMAAVSPALADKLAVSGRPDLCEPVFLHMLQEMGITLHDADYIFYLAEAEKAALLREQPASWVRLLTTEDSAAFAEFQSSASEEDLDAAYVELDHWLVFGAFEGDRLVCAASMYPWREESRIADMGILTLATHRGKGHARSVVRAISRHALGQGFEPQYRCQLDNAASTALAKAAGLTLFGEWQPVSPASDG